MKSLSNYLLPLLFLAFLSNYNQSCCRGDCDDEPIDTVKIIYDTLAQNDTFMQYWFFPVGSWWIYKRIDSNTNEYDTATVTYANSEFHPPKRGSISFFHAAQLRIEHTSKHIISPIQSNSRKELELSTSGINYLRGGGANGSQMSFGPFFKWPIELGNVGGSVTEIVDTNKLKITPNLDSVKSVHINTGKGLSNIESHVWLVKDIGFVKFKFPNGTEWELADYYISN